MVSSFSRPYLSGGVLVTTVTAPAITLSEEKGIGEMTEKISQVQKVNPKFKNTPTEALEDQKPTT